MEIDDRSLEMALNLMGYKTDAFTREVFVRTIDKIRELGDQFSIRDYTKIKAELCDKHGLDFETMRPVRHDDRRIFIARPTKNGYEYMTFGDEYSDNVEEAHDYKSFDFAEKMIVDKKLSGVMILTYYA